MEWLQVKSNFIETFLTGKASIVIDHGHVHTENLKRMRLADQLEMQLRLLGVSYTRCQKNDIRGKRPVRIKMNRRGQTLNSQGMKQTL
nr:YetF domain-containing protein [Bacillus subtilis]